MCIRDRSTQLAVTDGVRAALNLYAARPHAFDDEARSTAALFGVQAATLLYGSREASNLELAIRSRDLIGQAKGILIERYGVDDTEAFQMVVRASQDTNMKVVTVAEWLRGEAIGKNATRTRESGGHP